MSDTVPGEAGTDAPQGGGAAVAPAAADPLPEEPPAPEPAHREVLEALSSELGDALVGSELRSDDLWVRVHPDAWRRTAEFCRDSLGFDYFCFLSGIDWMPHTWPNPKVEGGTGEAGVAGDDDVAPEDQSPPEAQAGFETAGEPAGGQSAPDGRWPTGYAGGETRFQVLARLYSTTRHLGVTFKADLDADHPRVETWSQVYSGADWHERETWEMYGFDFVGHPNLTHLYLPSEFEGFPLRKDFPLLSREVKPWPGLVDVEPMPGEAGEAADEGGEPG